MKATVLVTRPAAQGAGWVQRLRTAGIDAAALPLIGIAPPADAEPVLAAWHTLAAEQLAAPRLVVFVSPNAVAQFFALRPAGLGWPAGTRAGSPGPGTSLALREFGVPEDRIVEPAAEAAQFDSEALWERLVDEPWAGAQVLIVRGDGGRDWLADTLRARGAAVMHLCAYRRMAPTFSADEEAQLQAAQDRPAQHVWLFSSSEAISTLRTARPDALWARSTAVATHPRIVAAARDAGFGRVEPVRPEFGAVLACLQSLPT